MSVFVSDVDYASFKSIYPCRNEPFFDFTVLVFSSLKHSDAPLVLNFIKHSACSFLQDVKGSRNCGVLAVQR